MKTTKIKDNKRYEKKYEKRRKQLLEIGKKAKNANTNAAKRQTLKTKFNVCTVHNNNSDYVV